MRKLATFLIFLLMIVIVMMLASACAGSNYAVKQDELIKRQKLKQRYVLIKPDRKKWR
jgi:hypothetical protein